MNDEATRKFIQAIKRLMTFCQRRYPTDPSRCVDFDGFSNAGRGAVGGGGDKAVGGEGCASGAGCRMHLIWLQVKVAKQALFVAGGLAAASPHRNTSSSFVL
jgi:hypothetical protein